MRRWFPPKAGFTLAELLVSIAILAVIGAFTLPKVLSSQSEKGYNAGAKAFASELQNAYTAYQDENLPNANTDLVALTPYLNYVRLDSTSTPLDYPDGSNTNCFGGGYGCLVLQNGARVRVGKTSWGYNFGDTAATSTVYVYYDPDGKDSSVHSLYMIMYIDGTVRSGSTKLPNSMSAGSNLSSWTDPSWFSWSN